MSAFSFLKGIFGSDRQLSAEDQGKLFEELLFLTLSRASRSDLDISEVEVSRIQEILKEVADIEATEQEIRTAGMSELYEVAPLEKYAAKAARGLSVAHRRTIIRALYDVIGADGIFSHTEADFFDTIAKAMNLRPIEMLGASIDGAED